MPLISQVCQINIGGFPRDNVTILTPLPAYTCGQSPGRVVKEARLTASKERSIMWSAGALPPGAPGSIKVYIPKSERVYKGCGEGHTAS